ncbi:VanW family protein [Patescibacteria group bacterium]|nr:VanW family protein [Patescibacteria group bacterium]
MNKRPVQTLAIIPLSILSIFGAGGNQNLISPSSGEQIVAEKEMSLANRYGNQFVNDVFKNNILLNIAYLSGKVASAKDIKWDEITKPSKYEFTLNPNKTFAFHQDVKEQYKDSLVKTTNANFNAQDGFKTDGYLFGDGVCHLASLINWVAQEAKLSVEAPTNHNFANIPDIPKQYGVSIYKNPGSCSSNQLQNLYITNNKSKTITFKFEYNNDKVKVSVVKLN